MPAFDPNRPWRHLYGAKWQRRRLRFLGKHPLCAMCANAGRIVPATVVDHRQPHKGDLALFWNEVNWQALCKTHHDSNKQAEERGNARHQAGVDGYPIDGGW